MIRFVSPGMYKIIAAGSVVTAIAAGLFISSCKSNNSPTNSNLGASATDVTLAPPPADSGFQIKLGPFDVPNGQEIQNNFYLKTPNNTDVYVTRVDFIFNPGSHHCNVFKSDVLDVADTVINTFNVDFTNWDMVCASQKDTLTWQLPPGCAFHLKAHQQMDFQSHYVNATTQQTPNGRGLALINFWTTTTPPAQYVGTVFSQNKTVDLQPHTEATYMKVVNAWPTDVNLLLMTGHFHSRGKSFIVGHYSTEHWSQTHQLVDTIYQNATWDEPPVEQFTTPLHIPAGDSIAYIASYENHSDNEIKFGGWVETQEHCNLFTFFYPAPDGNAIYDFTGGSMIETHPLP